MRRGAKTAHILHLPHAVDQVPITASRQELRAELGVSDHFVVTYAGSFSPYYKLLLLVEAAQILLKSEPEVVFLLIGTGADFEAVKSAVDQHKLSNVKLIGGILPQLVPQYLLASDLFIRPQHLPEFMDDTKILEYLSVGKPIVNICVDQAAQGQAEYHDVGRSVSPTDPREVDAAIRFFVENPSEAERAEQKRDTVGKASRRPLDGRPEVCAGVGECRHHTAREG